MTCDDDDSGGTPDQRVPPLALIIDTPVVGTRRAMFVHWSSATKGVNAMMGREVCLDYDIDPPGIIYPIPRQQELDRKNAHIVSPNIGVSISKVGGRSIEANSRSILVHISISITCTFTQSINQDRLRTHRSYDHSSPSKRWPMIVMLRLVG